MSQYLKKSILPALFTLPLLVAATGCLGSDDEDVSYDDWRKKNTAYFTEAQNSTVDGKPEYETISPVFAPSVKVLVKWHNDRSKTAANLQPLDNSTVNCKYICTDVDNNLIDTSIKSATDSIYQTRPTQNITGFWAVLTEMHVNDSVTCVIPYDAGYGNIAFGSIKPYTTLIYHIKLNSIVDYERP